MVLEKIRTRILNLNFKVAWERWMTFLSSSQNGCLAKFKFIGSIFRLGTCENAYATNDNKRLSNFFKLMRCNMKSLLFFLLISCCV